MRLLARPRHRWEDNIEWILEKQGGKVWTEFMWLGGGLFWTRQWIIGFHKRQGISLPTEWLL